ncbi:MAG: hypothetical protein A3K19_28030 [Lentisphaerae bacterium RIFOXYB12_FULL_65_16]|nr:MAG: hypothetical protein A3K18_27895 [Lentisphaerae bacterium RIFOXYA12_64_32]OGV88140.1 MAG: hypothetical protein A3K19_28030 [Lentisphaerae bacterium RIFOXYB12_FULL_65_16]
MLQTRARLAVFALGVAWLGAVQTLSAAVVWLTLGTAQSPALAPGGTVLESLADIIITAHEPSGTSHGSVDTSGLDTAAPGHFIGVLNVGDVPGGIVRLRAVSLSTGLGAELGQLTAWPDEFEPDVDPIAYGLTVDTIPWRDDRTRLNVTVTGRGAVSGVADDYAFLAAAELTPVPHPWWDFTAWTGDVPTGHEQDAPLLLTMDADKAVTAEFVRHVDDAWLLAHFGTTAVDLEDDPDADGFDTRDEFVNGTEPLDDTQVEAFLTFRAGWNFIALPVQPDGQVSMAGLLGPELVGPAWKWEPSARAYVQAESLQTKTGYWVKVRSDLGSVRVVGQPVTEPALYCYAGWNSVGPSASFPLLATVQDARVVAWYWDADTQAYRRTAPDEDVLSGHGYWLYTPEDVVVDASR